jgi:hypothetical protein
MPTKRTPRNPTRRTQFTTLAVETFRKMEQLSDQCTCDMSPPPNDEYKNEAYQAWWKKVHVVCPACEIWWKQHSILHRELHACPALFPCIEYPDSKPPEGRPQHWYCKPNSEAHRKLHRTRNCQQGRVTMTKDDDLEAARGVSAFECAASRVACADAFQRASRPRRGS